MEFWDRVFREVASNQANYDAKLIRYYESRRGKARSDPRYLCSPGDLVLLRMLRLHKFSVRAQGPYEFV